MTPTSKPCLISQFLALREICKFVSQSVCNGVLNPGLDYRQVFTCMYIPFLHIYMYISVNEYVNEKH